MAFVYVWVCGYVCKGGVYVLGYVCVRDGCVCRCVGVRGCVWVCV